MTLKKVNLKLNEINYETIINNYKFVILFVSILLFLPVFFGYFYIAGTDLNFTHYPNIFYGFSELNKYGSFPRWSEHIYNGFDFTQSFHSHWFNPFFWILSFFNQDKIFYIISIILFLSNFSIGLLWYKISKNKNLGNLSALIVAIITQSSTYFWWSMTTLINVQAFLFSSIIILLIFELNSKNKFFNFILITLCISLIISIGHVSYIFAHLITLVFISFVVHKNNLMNLLFLASCFMLAIIVTAFRWYFIYENLSLNYSQNASFGITHNPIFLLTFFNPLYLGPDIGSSALFVQNSGYTPGRHIQFHNALYFGLVPFLMCFISTIYKISFKKILLFLSLLSSIAINTQSFGLIEQLYYLIFSPFVHDAVPRIITIYSFAFLFIYCCDDFFEFLKNNNKLKNIDLAIYLIIFVSIFFSFYGYYKNLTEYLPHFNTHFILLFKILILSTCIFLFFYNILKKKIGCHKIFAFLYFASLTIFLSLTIILLNKLSLRQSFIFTTITKNFLIFYIFIFINYYFVIVRNLNFKIIFLVNIFLSLLLFINYGGTGPYDYIYMSSSISFNGWLISIIIVSFFILIINSKSINLEPKSLFITIFFLISFEQLYAFKNYSFSNLFNYQWYTNLKAYPKNLNNDIILKGLDKNLISEGIKNYKVNNPSIFFNYNDSEITGNINLIYGGMTYGGSSSIFPSAYKKFIQNFFKDDPNKMSRLGINNSLNDKKFLNIMGVGFIKEASKLDDKNKKYFIFNKDALPLFSFFENYECVNNSQNAIEALKKLNFIPKNKLIVTSNLNEQFCKKKLDHLNNSKMIKISFKKISSDKYVLSIPKNKTGFLHFNNNFSKYWKILNTESKAVITNGIFQGFYLENIDKEIIIEFNNHKFENLFILFKYYLLISIGMLIFLKLKYKFIKYYYKN